MCKKCNLSTDNATTLSFHARAQHKLSSKEYYDMYMKINNEDTCTVCGKYTRFKNISLGYGKTCSRACASVSPDRVSKILQTKISKYGEGMVSIYEKQKHTVSNWSAERKERYSATLSKSVKQAIKDNPDRIHRSLATKRQKYNWSEKIKQAHLQRTEEQILLANRKRKETCLNVYGVDCFAKTSKFKEIFKDILHKRSKEAKQQIISKCIATKISNFTMLPKDHPERLTKKKYKQACRHISEKWAKIKFNEHELAERKRCGVTGSTQLDHIVSLETCFRQRIPVEVAGHYVNLRLITWEENIKKSATDHLSTQELLQLFYDFDHSILLTANQIIPKNWIKDENV